MKSKIQFLYSLLMITVTLGLVAGASASATSVAVAGTETPLCQFEPPCSPGTWTFPGGNQHVRDWVLVYAVNGNDARIIGTNTLVANANWDASGFGPGWGTFHHQPTAYEDGYWEGTWTAAMTADGYVSKIVGRGYGQLDGLMYRATEVNGSFDGVIIELP